MRFTIAFLRTLTGIVLSRVEGLHIARSHLYLHAFYTTKTAINA